VFWTIKLIYSKKWRRFMCMPKHVDGKLISFMDGPFVHLRFVTYCLLPFVIILVLNVLIVARLRWTPVRLKAIGLAGSNPAVSLAGLEASSVGMATVATEGGAVNSRGSSTVRLAANASASASALAAASRQRQQARPPTPLIVSSSVSQPATDNDALQAYTRLHISVHTFSQ